MAKAKLYNIAENNILELKHRSDADRMEIRNMTVVGVRDAKNNENSHDKKLQMRCDKDEFINCPTQPILLFLVLAV